MLSQTEENEIAVLAARYGEPLRWVREYAPQTPRNIEWAKNIGRRRAEAILVVPRPGGKILLHTKGSYPDGVYRLPGGGINPGEAAEHAAKRELMEEMGFDAPLARLLGVAENRFRLPDRVISYPSFVFLTSPTSEPPRVMDPDEAIADFQERAISDLAQVAEQLASLPRDWQPWGAFRAAPHELALQALARKPG